MHALAIRQARPAPPVRRWRCAALALAVCAAALPAAAGARRDARLRRAHERDALDPGRSGRGGQRALARRRRSRRAAMELVATDANDHVVVARLDRTQPSGTAAYRVAAGADHREGRAARAALLGKAQDASELTDRDRLLLLPRRRQSRAFPARTTAAASRSSTRSPRRRPDLMLWLGDNLYLQQPDLLDPQSMAMRYRRQRSSSRCRGCSPRRRTSRSGTTTITARTTATRRTCFKGETLKLFQRYWPNPSFGLPDVPGDVRRRALRRRALLPARRPLLPLSRPLAGRPRQDDVRRAPARMAEAGARLRAAQRDQDRRRRQPVLEPREPLRGLASVRAPSGSAFAEWLRRAEDRRRDLPLRRPPFFASS